MIDPKDPIQNKRFILDLEAKVERYCVEKFTDDPRNHLGASIIGSDCLAFNWGVFRWLKQEPFSGRMLRLFNRGHKEEARFVEWLQGGGFNVWEVNPDTGDQYKISGVKGHFGGSLDAIVSHPDLPGFGLAEFKTHSENSFNDLKKKKVIRSKPKHWRQMCSYGRAYNLSWGIYYAVNKNDDELYNELLPLDYNEADYMFRKADSIINSQEQPQKIAQVAEYSECKYCAFSGICFKGELPEKNCRSCKNAFPVDNGEWLCSLVGQNIPPDVIRTGCDAWQRII